MATAFSVKTDEMRGISEEYTNQGILLENETATIEQLKGELLAAGSSYENLSDTICKLLEKLQLIYLGLKSLGLCLEDILGDYEGSETESAEISDLITAITTLINLLIQREQEGNGGGSGNGGNTDKGNGGSGSGSGSGNGNSSGKGKDNGNGSGKGKDNGNGNGTGSGKGKDNGNGSGTDSDPNPNPGPTNSSGSAVEDLHCNNDRMKSLLQDGDNKLYIDGYYIDVSKWNKDDIGDAKHITDLNDLTALAISYVGNKYVWGGNSLDNGVDCSGFVHEIYKEFGVDVPRTTADMLPYAKGEKKLDGFETVKYSDIQPGDILVYPAEPPTYKSRHEAIYLGDNLYVHASNEKAYSNNGGIKIDTLGTSRKSEPYVLRYTGK